VERNLLKINKKSSRFLKKKEKKNVGKNNFYELKKIGKRKKQKKKIFFCEIYAKKGHNKTGCAKVVAPKRRASFFHFIHSLVY